MVADAAALGTVAALTKLVEAAGHVVISLGKILMNNNRSNEEKLTEAENLLKAEIAKGLRAKGRFFFGSARMDLKFFSSSVAVEELHDCYFDQCTIQMAADCVAHKGCVFVMYGVKGSGKSLSALSLLTMRHSQAPRLGILFGGRTFYKDGGDYFKSLLNQTIGNNRIDLFGLSLLSDVGMFSPSGLASFLLELLPVEVKYLHANNSKWGVGEVPGLGEYLKNVKFARKYGGTPVLVFEDVNIGLSARQDGIGDKAQKKKWNEEMGAAGELFTSLVTEGYERGIIVFVTTNSLEVAAYFTMLNGNTKAQTFKPLRDKRNFTCQLFNWSHAKRVEFLQLQNTLVDGGQRLSNGEIEVIVTQALSSDPPTNVREMHSSFIRDSAMLLPVRSEFQPNSGGFGGLFRNCRNG